MEIQKAPKLFAFKLAEKQASEAKSAPQWKVREGVAIAGCCDFHNDDNLREDDPWFGRDAGIYC